MIHIENNFLPQELFEELQNYCLDFKNEQWKGIHGFEDKYEISTYGRVRSVKSNKLINERQNRRGQSIVSLNNKSEGKKHFLVSRLVAIAFIPNPLNLPDVDHIIENGDKTNNHISNLQWITKRDNTNKYLRETKKARPYTGVKRVKDKYQCSLRLNGKEHYIGTYDTPEEANNIYKIISTEPHRLYEFRKVKTKGYSFNKRTNKWASYCYINKEKIHLGYYQTEQEAEDAYINFIQQNHDSNKR
ncbi:hypothetical protein AS361_03800 [Myroides marinus]|uniref:NUMOD4 domain-containing protein n=1 Tax=Myroides marinus TaxID=703342 RepID=UPI0007423682|nr:NUMOD4 domain-containing protein [Myroides marinus]KUF38981.1 hypothetical protein AS361_03800 [Myroides marinus]